MLKELEHWDQWEENPVVIVPDRPVDTIQAKIEQYRQQASKPPESTEEQQPDFFEVVFFFYFYYILIIINNNKYIYI